MEQPINVVRLRQPDDIDDRLTEVLRAGARRLLAQAVDLEVDGFLAERADLKLADGRARLVRHGHGPEREVQTGIGAVAVARPKVRDRGGAEDGERIRFTSAILPLWARRTRSLDALLPTLYLRGISTGDFQEALSALLGKDAPNLSPSVVSRLTTEWQTEYGRWQARDLSARRYVYVWADGVYLQARMLKSIARLDLLILDDWGLSILTHSQRIDLLEILEERYARRSTIVTSQLPVTAWHDVIADPTYADAILDRLLHNAHRLDLEGQSRRRGKSQPQA